MGQLDLYDTLKENARPMIASRYEQQRVSGLGCAFGGVSSVVKRKGDYYKPCKLRNGFHKLERKNTVNL